MHSYVSGFLRTVWVASALMVGFVFSADVLAGALSPFGVEVVSYVPGSSPATGYTDPSTALGFPETVTGEAFGSAGVVSVFNPAFGQDEIVSVGGGGSLTLRLGVPVTDAADHLYGVDFIVFGNAGFFDGDFPAAVVPNSAGIFGGDGGEVQVSEDGINFVSVSESVADGLFPTQAYLDAGPYDVEAGSVLADVFRPIDPAIALGDFSGATFEQVLDLYGGSAGGSSIDISGTGLDVIEFVRFVVPTGGPNIEIDSVVVVPEPSALLLAMGLGCVGILTRRR